MADQSDQLSAPMELVGRLGQLSVRGLEELLGKLSSVSEMGRLKALLMKALSLGPWWKDWWMG